MHMTKSYNFSVPEELVGNKYWAAGHEQNQDTNNKSVLHINMPNLNLNNSDSHLI